MIEYAIEFRLLSNINRVGVRVVFVLVSHANVEVANFSMQGEVPRRIGVALPIFFVIYAAV